MKVYDKEHSVGNTERVGELTFLDSDDDLIDRRSTIFIGEYRGQRVAVKQVPRHDMEQQQELTLFKKMEKEVLSNVLKISCIEKHRKHYYVATPLCEYDLSHIIGAEADKSRAGKNLTPEKRVRMGVEILTGLKGLHDLEIIHRDLKPRNVLIGEYFKACTV